MRCYSLLLVLVAVAVADENYVEYEEYVVSGDGGGVSVDRDQCNDYDDGNADALCRHADFPVVDLKKRYGSQIKTCCQEHAYVFYDNCKTRPETVHAMACGSPHSPPKLPTSPVRCAEYCHKLEFVNKKDFSVDIGNGRVIMNSTAPPGSRLAPVVTDYCMAYTCTSVSKDAHRWEESLAEVCLCHENIDVLKSINDTIDQALPRCCPQTLQVHLNKKEHGVEDLTCPRATASLQTESTSSRLSTCSGKWLLVDAAAVSVRVDPDSNATLVSFNDSHYGVSVVDRALTSVNGSDDDASAAPKACAGVKLAPHYIAQRPFEAKFLYCHENRCHGKKPCYSTCCKKGQYSQDGSCKPMNATRLASAMANSDLRADGLDLSHFETAWQWERRCPSTDYTRKKLKPKDSCSHAFHLEMSDSQSVGLTLTNRKLEDVTGDFCLDFDEDGDLEAEVCLIVDRQDRLGYYPYLLAISSFFLLVTLIVYSVWSELLDLNARGFTSYRRFMRHFAFNMFVAFALLSLNQFVYLGHHSKGLCVFFAFLLQYSFLVSFSFLTIMSETVTLQLRGQMETKRRYRIQRFLGYSMSLLLVAVTAVVEFTADECAPFRPRFGQGKCFFGDPLTTTWFGKLAWSKFLFFYMPLAAMLFGNFVMFVIAARQIYVITRQRQQVISGNDKSNFVNYVSLFFGMGLFWSFEIFAGMSDSNEHYWAVPDIINMLQGVYIFAIFVCKPRVLKKIFGVRPKVSGTGAPTKGKTRPTPAMEETRDPSSMVNTMPTGSTDAMPMVCYKDMSTTDDQ